MKKATLKDYVIFKIRYYADKKLLDRYYKDPNHRDKGYPDQHRERAEAYNKFKRDLFSFVAKVSFYDYVRKYGIGSWDCMREELWADHDIFINDGATNCIMYVPVNNVELVEWVTDSLNNNILPWKTLKRASLFFLRFNTKETWRRDEAAKLQKDIIKEYFTPRR